MTSLELILQQLLGFRPYLPQVFPGLLSRSGFTSESEGQFTYRLGPDRLEVQEECVSAGAPPARGSVTAAPPDSVAEAVPRGTPPCWWVSMGDAGPGG